MTAEDISILIDRMAEDKATKLRTLAKATVVMVCAPEWMRAEEVNAYFGLPHNQLIALACAGKVVARKSDPTNAKSASLFKTQSIRAAIDAMMPYDKWASLRPDLQSATA